MKYAVRVTDAAYEAIRDQARYIAVESHAPLNATRWLERVWDVVHRLETLPRRYPTAAESALKPYEIRRALVDNCHILFSIDDRKHGVWVIAFRLGSRLPRPGELPERAP